MQNSTQFWFVVSGMPFILSNDLNNTGSLTVAYTPSLAAQSYSVAVEGIVSASGEVAVLDSFSGSGSSGQRSISLSGVTYDSFRFVPSWTGSPQNFVVSASVQSTGAGATFSAILNLPNIYSRTS